MNSARSARPFSFRSACLPLVKAYGIAVRGEPMWYVSNALLYIYNAPLPMDLLGGFLTSYSFACMILRPERNPVHYAIYQSQD